ncbi:hypothetical protein C7974DRAFT_64864 [Boeremia exigua]|uniref:uncharacterized protein n=1 Tax=Boeremia exigua TaxID=749465 RepID=UPI001E8CCCFE|nr:uncharacterized protein C7974DRAFT_64864 [Boeremia exigua]KAH6615369.1 hypothetical protein C7974DRAFT_64864 [Boeremia exigua]
MAGAKSNQIRRLFETNEYSAAVSVDQRALINTVLARYSTKFAAFRELISNAADAAATTVKIQITTSPRTPSNPNVPPASSPDLVRLHNVVREVVVHNNGKFFGPDDWDRLTKIGKGNPNINTIGMFGLGFYSVFELTDEPIIVSRAEAVAFQWMGDMLHHKHVKLPPESCIQETQVIMKYKDVTAKVPNLSELGQFLACSLAFVNLSNMELWLDDWKILALSKSTDTTSDLPLTDIRTVTDHMSINAIKQKMLHLHATWLDGILDEIVSSPPVSRSKLAEPLVTTRFEEFNGPFPSFNPQSPELRIPCSPASDLSARRAGHWKRLVCSLRDRFRCYVRTYQSPVEQLLHQGHSCEAGGMSESVLNATMSVHITEATVSTHNLIQLSSELKTVMRKEVPNKFSVSIVTSCEDNSRSCSLFKLVAPSESEPGRIITGLPTLQSTGIQAHILIPAILDMHRGLIDLTTKHVQVWNQELLQIAGIVSRVIWTQRMETVNLMEKSNPSPVDLYLQREALVPKKRESQLAGATRMFRLFYFKDSVPDTAVGCIIQDYFWRASNSIKIISTQGVRKSDDVRLADPRISGFITSFPTLPRRLAKTFKVFVTALHTRRLISNVSTKDIHDELKKNILSTAQFHRLLDWGFSADKQSLESIIQVMKAATINLPGRTNIALKDVKYFSEYEIPEGLVPWNTIAYSDLREHVSRTQLRRIGWKSLPIVEWIRRLHPRLQDVIEDEATAEKILAMVSSNLPENEYEFVVKYLPKVPITKGGLRTPETSYFRIDTPFENLSHLSYVREMPGVSRALLEKMGVRSTVEMNEVVKHLDSVQDDFSTLGAYVSYLIEMHQPPSEEDKKILCVARVWYAEEPNQNGHRKGKKYKLDELFEPSAATQKLLLPTLFLPQTYRPDSPMGNLFRLLGLKQHPSVPELFDIVEKAISESDYVLRDRALRYFIDNFENNGDYKAHDLTNVTSKILPIERSESQHAAPNACFTNKKVTLLNLDILAERFHPFSMKLGVQSDPPLQQCIDRLLDERPTTMERAADIFEYISSLGTLDDACKSRLKSSSFVPVPTGLIRNGTTSNVNNRNGDPVYVHPHDCYVGPFTEDFEELSGLFVYIRVERARLFLAHCGAAATPSAYVVAERFMETPGEVMRVLNKDPATYIRWFVWLGEQYKKGRICRDLIERTKENAFIPTIRYTNNQQSFVLTKPDTAVVHDDIHLSELFSDALHIVPQKDEVEQFCLSLGCKRLSAAVKTVCIPRQTADSQDYTPRKHRLLDQLRVFMTCLDVRRVRLSWEMLRNNLQINFVNQIDMRCTYKGVQKAGQTNAFAEIHGSNPILWMIEGKFEAFELSRELVKLILKFPKPVDFLTLETILRSDLADLKRRGYGIERILGQDMDITRLPVYQDETEESRQISTSLPDIGRHSGSAVKHSRTASGIPNFGERALNTESEKARSDVGVGHDLRNAVPFEGWSVVPQYDRQALDDILPRAAPQSDLDFMNMNNWATFSVPPSTMFIAKETNETRYFGELYMSQFLSSRLAKGTYQPNKHWTSPMRSRNGHEPFTARPGDDHFSAFTIIQERGELRQAVVRACRINDSTLDQQCTFHIEVCATNNGLHSSFRLSNSQYLKAKSMFHATETTIKDVFILARVYKVKYDPGIALYVDPWRLHLEGLLRLDSASTYQASISERAQAMLEETSANEKPSVGPNKIYKGLAINGDRFRLMRLVSNADENAPLRCTLSRYKLNETDFTAISYVWGPRPSRLSPFLLEVNGTTISITESLWTCLHCLRRGACQDLLWADAVCIDQNDAVEKSIQVRRMGTLYSRAKKVIIWMGNNKDKDCRVIDLLANKRSIRDQVRISNNGSEDLEHLSGADIDAFLQRPWFRRTWTIQELVFGSDVVVMLGDSQIKWDNFIGRLKKYVQYSQSDQAQDRRSSRYVLQNLGPVLTLDRIRKLYQGRGQKETSNRYKHEFLEILEMFFYTRSSRHRDKLFALINMACDTENHDAFIPDYESSAQVILSRYASQFVKSGHALDLLYRAGSERGSRFCSWIPDLMNHRRTDRYAPTISTWPATGSGSSHGFSAGAGMFHAPDPQIRICSTVFQHYKSDHDVPMLAIKGKIFDCIRSCRPLKISPDGTVIHPSEALADFERYISPMTDVKSKDWKEKLLMRFFVGDAGGPQSKSPLPFSETMNMESSEAWPQDLKEHVLSAKPGVDGRELMNKSPEAQSHINAFWQTACNFLGRIPSATACQTEKNYVGIVPGHACVGDKIFVASGAKVPFLIREHSEVRIKPSKDSKRYQQRRLFTLEGECFIDGIMYYTQDPGLASIESSIVYLI